jgi:predicted secreted protein
LSIGGGIAVFLILWWLVLFTVLPFGVRSQHETNDIVPGSEPGAPEKPALWRKLVVTTVIAAFFWFAVFAALQKHWIVL